MVKKRETNFDPTTPTGRWGWFDHYNPTNPDFDDEQTEAYVYVNFIYPALSKLFTPEEIGNAKIDPTLSPKELLKRLNDKVSDLFVMLEEGYRQIWRAVDFDEKPGKEKYFRLLRFLAQPRRSVDEDTINVTPHEFWDQHFKKSFFKRAMAILHLLNLDRMLEEHCAEELCYLYEQMWDFNYTLAFSEPPANKFPVYLERSKKGEDNYKEQKNLTAAFLEKMRRNKVAFQDFCKKTYDNRMHQIGTECKIKSDSKREEIYADLKKLPGFVHLRKPRSSK